MSPPLTPAPPRTEKPTRLVRWQRRVLGLCFVVFAFELGLFLLVYPWLRSWDVSWIPLHSPRFAALWMNSSFRGAISGLGLLNIYIALVEAVRLLRTLFNHSGTLR